MPETSRRPESWLPVAGYEGCYEVSNLGRVRSVARKLEYRGRGGPAFRSWPSCILRQVPLDSGHLRVTLASAEHVKRTVSVHTLVLTAFVGPRPDGMECCHGDDDPANNHVGNLRWDTKSANQLDCVRHGNHYEARKRRCPRDHSLAVPNLMPSQLKQGARSCLACARAHAFARTRGIRVVDPRFKAIADSYYGEIMRAA